MGIHFRDNFSRLDAHASTTILGAKVTVKAANIIFSRPSGREGVELLRAHYERHAFSRHSHDGYALGLIEDGALRFRYQHREHVAQPGEINLVVPGECHDGRAGDSKGWTYRMFYLSAQVLLDAANELGIGGGLPDFAAGVLQDPELAECIRTAHIRLMHPDAGMLEKESRLLHLLTFWIRRHAEQPGSMPRPGAEPQAVRRAKDYLAVHYAHNAGLADLAAAADMSPFHLLRVFTRTTGQTPHEFLIQKRVDAAKELLRTRLPLARIAADCGFADQSHMTRLFRRQHGLTPGKYRNILLNRAGEKP